MQALNISHITWKSWKPIASMAICVLINTFDRSMLVHHTGQVESNDFFVAKLKPRNGSFFDYKPKDFADNACKHRDKSSLIGFASSLVTLIEVG
jgi:hypothetical protein